jgi:hypothetical protein
MLAGWAGGKTPTRAASHELRCRRAGIAVHYCAEQFENDGSIGSSIIKTVKRAMAGEYSRELSVKVFAGQANLIRLGYRQGGAAGFGLRRLLVDQHGEAKEELERGQQKSIATDRVILIPGPEAEVKVVQGLSAVRRRQQRAGNRRSAKWPRPAHRPRSHLDTRDGPSASDEREIYRQQRLGADLLQIKGAACFQPA